MRYYYYLLGLALYFILPIAAQIPQQKTEHTPTNMVEKHELDFIASNIKDLTNKINTLEENQHAMHDQLKIVTECLTTLTNSISSSIGFSDNLTKPADLAVTSKLFKSQADTLNTHIKHKFNNHQNQITLLQTQIQALILLSHPQFEKK